MRSLFNMSSTMLDIIDMLLGRSLSLPSTISVHEWVGLTSIDAINSNSSLKSSGLIKPMFISVMIVAIFLSYIVLIRSTLRTVWFQPSSSHLCVCYSETSPFLGAGPVHIHRSYQRGLQRGLLLGLVCSYSTPTMRTIITTQLSSIPLTLDGL